MSYNVGKRVAEVVYVGEGKHKAKVSTLWNGTKSVVPLVQDKLKIYSVFTTSILGNVVTLKGQYSSLSKALDQAKFLLRRCPDCKLVQVFCKGNECYSLSRS